MSASVIDIYNWALAAIGTKSRVQSPTEVSPEAEQCSLWYENVRDQILGSAPWDSARVFKRLAVSAEQDGADAWINTDPAPGWRFAYAAPSDMLRPRYLSDYSRFELGINSLDQHVIYTNSAQTILCYTKRQTKVALWSAELQAAVSFGLAAHIAMKLTGSKEKVQLVTAQAIDKIISARQTAANTPNFGYESIPDWIAARGYSGSAPTSPYIYPWAEFTVAGFSYEAS